MDYKKQGEFERCEVNNPSVNHNINQCVKGKHIETFENVKILEFIEQHVPELVRAYFFREMDDNWT